MAQEWSLFHRILTQPTLMYPATEEVTKWAESRVHNYFRTELVDQPKFDVTNVSDYILSNPERYWPLDEMPNMAPPFNTFWLEWSRTYGAIFPGTRLGMQVSVTTPDVVKGYTDSGYVSTTARWVLIADMWITHNGPQVHGKPVWTGINQMIWVGPDGKAEREHDSTCYTSYMKPEESTQPNEGINILGLALSFMHCKNVTQREVSRDVPERLIRRHNHPPKDTYRVLDINPMKKVLRTEGNSDTEGLQRALHICRGHFAHYSEEAPLFGKLSGQFWIPAHVRGSTERGKVTKNYRVSPG